MMEQTFFRLMVGKLLKILIFLVSELSQAQVSLSPNFN